MRKSARTQIPPFFDNDPYIYIYIKDFIRLIPGKFSQNIASSLGGDVFLSNRFQRTSNNHKSSPSADGLGELKKTIAFFVNERRL